jgi:hypothetical protein
MSFSGKFSTNINVSMGFSVFWAKNGSKHVLCHIYPSQQQTPERWPTSDLVHILTIPITIRSQSFIRIRGNLFWGHSISAPPFTYEVG